MSDNNDPSGINRRDMLKRTTAVSAAALFATGTTAANSGEEVEEVVLNEIDLDTSEFSDLEEASVVFLEKGDRKSIRTTVHSAHEVDPDGASEDADPTRVDYKFSFDGNTEAAATDSEAGTMAADDASQFGSDNFSLERTESASSLPAHLKEEAREQSDEVGTHIPDEPDFSNLGDATTWVETKSSECGPLVRTNLVIEYFSVGDSNYIEDSIGIFETADGESCDGEEYGDRFPCDELPGGVDCEVHDSFNTTWNLDSSDYDNTSAEAEYYNTDFPIIPESTADHTQDTWFDDTTLHVEGSVEHSGTFGFANIVQFLLDYDFVAMYY